MLRIKAYIPVLLVLVMIAISISGSDLLAAEAGIGNASFDSTVPIDDENKNMYLHWLTKINKNPPLTESDQTIIVPAVDYKAKSKQAVIEVGEGGEGINWTNEEGWIEWEVRIPEDGLYQIGLTYDSVEKGITDLIRGVQVDGQYPFTEAENLVLKREFVHETYPPKLDSFGNEMRSLSIEVRGWKSALFSDYKVDTEPLKWFLPKGVHTVRLIGKVESIKIKQISFVPYRPASAYSQKQLESKDLDGDWISIVEAENILKKSNPSVSLQSFNDPGISRPTKGLVVFNALGGTQFGKSGQWVEWEFEVPRSGHYEIGFKYIQKYLNNFYAYRTIMIDGKIPFKEMELVKFPYDTDWRGLTLSDGTGETLMIYLEKGFHTLRMTTTAAPIKPVYEGLLRNMRLLTNLEFSIRKVTGNYDKTKKGNTDMNRDWELEKYIPDLKERYNDIIDDLHRQADLLAALSKGTSDTENAVRMAARDLMYLRDHPRDVPNEMEMFPKIQNNLGIWLFRLLDQPVAFDFFWVAEPGAKTPKATPTFFEKLGNTLKNFYYTFVIDYEFRRSDPNAIDVWVNRGRDYVNLIQQMADESFTSQTGIPVNVNIVPDPQMFILGNAAGIQPDVALGVQEMMPIDFATRGALVDLSQFADYPKVASQFHPGALRVFHYNEGEYALPEIQGFNVLFYRKDILQGLGLQPPDTWDDVYKILPSLQQKGYDFHIPPKDFLPYLYQNGAELYSENGMRSGLDSDEAFRGFRQWTELFTLYQIPREVPSFFNHFRLGDIPVGIADFNTYLQIMFAAPEIAGKWDIKPIPGIEKNGEIVRWAGGLMQAGVIFKKTKKKEAAWEFLKWWVSEETQEQFGNEIESAFGEEYRWNTANLQAFKKLPWPKKDLEVIMEQWKWYKDTPLVPGGYFTTRQLDFAWNKVVLNNANPREALEEAVIDINREMYRKQIEFKLRDRNGRILDEIGVMQVNEPWDKGDSR
jgi:ABC-type glycerol-3-phosphate transport system substrate-binding protein